MKLKYKDMIKALNAVEEERNIPEDVIVDALKEAMAKAYKKDAELSDIDVVARINEKDKTIDLYQNYKVVPSDDDVQDDELEIGLEEAKALDPDAEVDGTVSRLIEINGMSRAAVSIAKNVMRQKIREAEKVAVYNEYIDQKDEMVIGVVESVKEKFALINLGRTVAMMPHSAQIPGERLREGDRIRVVITEVNKETKGSQVLVSRADPMLVRRLFEKEVPEIYDGIVEIKAIAREAGERTKMAVLSHDPSIDPIGACIGPRGTRVQQIIDELHGEKIDIFQYSDDLTELVRNALAPAVVNAVLPGDDDHSLIVIVDDDQLSLAIGKRGKNARLAVKLTNHKIDIKTRSALEEEGKDYDALVAEAEVKRQEYLKEAHKKEIARMEKEAEAAEEKRKAAAAKFAAANADAPVEEEDGFIPEEMQEGLDENIITSIDEDNSEEKKDNAEAEAEPETNEPAEEPAEAETETEAEEETDNESVEEDKEEFEEVREDTEESTPEMKPVEKKKTESHKHADLEEMAANNTYVSRFEKLADTSKKDDQKSKKKWKKHKSDDENYRVNNKELEEEVKKKLAANVHAAKPVYSDEELAEIEAEQEAEEEKEYDFDYDEYEDFYDEDDN